VSASVSTDGAGNFTLSLSAGSAAPITIRGTSKRASLASAEVIAEAPASNHGPNGELPLTNFGSVAFTNATVDGTPLGSLSPDPITMVQGGVTMAQPSTISDGNFSIAWQASSGPPPAHGHK
jgi:hypothetical protein